MLEPLLQDYISLIASLDRQTFVQRINAPVLISRAAQEAFAFQSASTQLFPPQKPGGTGVGKGELRQNLPVIELRKAGSQRQLEIAIGRSEDNDVVIPDETVSSLHAIFYQEAKSGRNMLYDLDSTNGTAINGSALIPNRAVELRDGDVINFGDTEFYFYSPGGLYDCLLEIFKTPLSSAPPLPGTE